ncbi:MAG TPA: hypothetical protein DCZ03_00415 [Gammaproteobacteria bacterium]|nr:hypothetical protein [Gammaproteobacteria bacterium]
MKESLLDVLIYLFENYVFFGDVDRDEESLKARLLRAGFELHDINKAFAWMEGLTALPETIAPIPASTGAIRAFNPIECMKLDTECRGFLLFLEQIGVLDPALRELVIDQVMDLDSSEVSLDQLRWAVLMVLFENTATDGSMAWMDDWVGALTTSYLQ